MSRLRDVKAELAKMKREMEAKEAELRKELSAPSMKVIYEMMLDSDEMCEKMNGFSKDEIRVIAKHIIVNMNSIIAESVTELEEVRARKAERAARRKAAKEAMENDAEDDADDDSELDETDESSYDDDLWNPRKFVDDPEFVYHGEDR